MPGSRISLRVSANVWRRFNEQTTASSDSLTQLPRRRYWSHGPAFLCSRLGDRPTAVLCLLSVCRTHLAGRGHGLPRISYDSLPDRRAMGLATAPYLRGRGPNTPMVGDSFHPRHHWDKRVVSLGRGFGWRQLKDC